MKLSNEELLSSDILIKRLRYQGRQYDSGQQSRGGCPETPHMLIQAANMIEKLQEAAKLLRDEWIPIKEFLEEPVEGPYWITNKKVMYQVYYDGLFFHGSYFSVTEITHVIPIKKPGLPK